MTCNVLPENPPPLSCVPPTPPMPITCFFFSGTKRNKKKKKKELKGSTTTTITTTTTTHLSLSSLHQVTSNPQRTRHKQHLGLRLAPHQLPEILILHDQCHVGFCPFGPSAFADYWSAAAAAASGGGGWLLPQVDVP